MIGRVFDDRYEIIRRLGSGGMADVYLARDRHLDRQVALKILHARLAEDEQFIERFRREASNAAGLNHHNIVQIYDRGEAEGTYYIAMEYLEGQALKDIIHAHAPLRKEHIVSVTGQILEALRFAHRKDIIHRDIKPQNIMVDDEGRVKVTDFGIARAGSEARMTDTGSIVGTAHYLSPEQAAGGRVEAASDLYSLGVLMYEMATGRLPFSGDNAVAIAMRHVNEPPLPPREINSNLDENLERVILRALAKRPEQRYITADAFQEDLRRAGAGQEVATPAPFVDEESTRLMRDDAPTRVMGGAPAAAAAGAAGRTMVRPGPPHYGGGYGGPGGGAGDILAEEERRSRIWPWLLVLLFLALLGGAVWALLGQLQEGQVPIVVPGVVGETEEDARDTIEGLGLTFEVTEPRPFSDEVEAGIVMKQDPEQGAELTAGDPVRVVVSAGEEVLEVPDVRGMTLENAATELGLAGFQMDDDPQEETSEEVDEGLITRQDPRPGETAPRGTKIELRVSTGPAVDRVEVPNLVGRTESEALALLEGRNLVAAPSRAFAAEPAGQVIEQSPPPGREVAEGSSVSFVVSRGPEPVTVPDVVDETEEEARFRLGQARLGVRVEQTPSPAEAGIVIQQDPEADEEVPAGTVVTIVVSTGPPETSTTSTTIAPPGASLPSGQGNNNRPPGLVDRGKN